MIRFSKLCFLSLILMFVIGLSSTGFAETKIVIEPKAENFVYFVDNSGSMAFDYEALGMTKSKVARDILLAINNELPELDANFGVYTYAPYKEYKAVSGFNRQALNESVTAIPIDFDIFKRQTPAGSGLLDIDKKLAGLQDRMAVVVVTDGESNLGPDPLPVMQDMYNRYGNRICFHFISLAQTPEEKAFVNDLAGINACSVQADASDIAKDFVRADFMQKVFYDSKQVTIAPEPKPEPKPEPEPTEEVIVFSNVTFDFDSAQIKPEYRDILKEAAQIIKGRAGKKVMVEGHTCNIGPAKYNMGLSQRRAQSVADFLAEHGVSKDRLETKGYGLTNPKFDNSTREGRSLNRRVEMHL
ncbi:MAG: OmpA family protein, partial [Desulfonatronovibrio sp.]